MGECIRPSQMGCQSGTVGLFRLAAVFLTTWACGQVFAATEATEEPASPPPFVNAISDQLVSIRNTEVGSEGVTLTARLSAHSLSPAQDVSWRIHNAAGEILIESRSGEIDANLPPGEYQVTAALGFLQITEPLTVPRGSKLQISYILNAGALRLLPRLGGAMNRELEAQNKVFALDGTVQGNLIATSRVPGEVLMLAAGRYRIESTFAAGNARAVTDVHVKPGIMSAVDIDHIATAVKLEANGVVSDASIWSVVAGNGDDVAEIMGATGLLALHPGSYTATLTTPTVRNTQNFSIEAGGPQSITVVIAP